MHQAVLTTVYIITLILPLFAGVYSFWSSSKADGFDQERTFDIVVLGLLGGLLFGVISSLAVFNFSLSQSSLYSHVSYLAVIFGFIVSLCLVSLKWRWSVYRVLDNFSVSFILAVAMWLLMQNVRLSVRPAFLLGPLVLLVANYFLRKYRLEVVKSGYTFCIVSGVFCLAAALSSRDTLNLIFLGLLFTLTLLVLIFRSKGLYGRIKKNGGAPSTT